MTNVFSADQVEPYVRKFRLAVAAAFAPILAFSSKRMLAFLLLMLKPMMMMLVMMQMILLNTSYDDSYAAANDANGLTANSLTHCSSTINHRVTMREQVNA